jgi:hypothetical protein
MKVKYLHEEKIGTGPAVRKSPFLVVFAKSQLLVAKRSLGTRAGVNAEMIENIWKSPSADRGGALH